MNKELFIEELKKLNIEVTEDKLTKLEKYYQLLVSENKLYNLTAITEEKQVYLKHFYDSLTISKTINITTQSIIDLGTGAGFPGMVLKIFYPEIKLTLLDSTLKKCNFLKKVTEELKLNNVTIINERAENYSKNNREIYDVVVSRAVAPLKHLLEYGVPLLKINGIFISMKGNIENDITNIDNYINKLNLSPIDITSFMLPIEESNRNLVKFIKLAKTPDIYPRKYTDIKKEKI